MASRLLKSTRTTLLSVPTKTLTRFAPPPHHILHAPTTTLLSVPTKTLTRFAPPPPPPPHHILHAPTTTTIPPRFPILSAPHLLTTRPVPPHLHLLTRGYSSPGDNLTPLRVALSKAKVVISNATKRVSDWVDLQPFPPAVRHSLQIILKGMLFAAGEKAFEQLVRLFFLVMGRLQRWWKGDKGEKAEDEAEDEEQGWELGFTFFCFFFLSIYIYIYI